MKEKTDALSLFRHQETYDIVHGPLSVSCLDDSAAHCMFAVLPSLCKVKGHVTTRLISR